MGETDYKLLLSKVKGYVETYFQAHNDPRYHYHNIEHTKRVVNAAKEIGNHFQLNESDFFTVVASGWFHDLGYFTSSNAHEIEGARLAREFLTKEGADEEVIKKIEACILATKMPQNPKVLNERIVCDADLYHLGTDEFTRVNKELRKEIEAFSGKKMDKVEWVRSSINLLETHKYYTDYGRLVLNDKVSKNLQDQQKKLKKLLRKLSKQPESIIPGAISEIGRNPRKNEADEADKSLGRGKKKDKDEKDKRPDKGIETMFRVTSNNNQRLSRLADNKSHIMITVNSIILSAIIGLLLRTLHEGSPLLIPTYIILLVCVLTIIFSVLATRPTVPEGRFTQQNLDDKDVNLLFFGNFYKMSLEDYAKGMWTVMESREFLYGSLIRDVYAQGVVLGKKYRYLRISYNIFMFGLIVSVVGYILATLI